MNVNVQSYAQNLEVYQGSVYTVTHYGDGQSGHWVELKDTGWISAGDKAKYRHIPGLAEVRTRQSALLMELLQRAYIPTAFERQVSADTVRCCKVAMIPVEHVVRCVVDGSGVSYYAGKYGRGAVLPHPMHEMFYKGALDRRDRQHPVLVDTHIIKTGEGATPDGVYTDPRIIVRGDEWLLYAPKTALADIYEGETPLWRGPAKTCHRENEQMRALAERVLSTLQHFSRKVGYGVVDFKLEFGKTTDGQIVLADVLNQDNMRLLPVGATVDDQVLKVSKDLFRAMKGDELGLESTVMAHYLQGLRVIEQIAAQA